MDNEIKVLMFGWEFPPYNSGGLGVACRGLGKALAAENVSLTLVLPKKIEGADPNLNIVFANVPNVRVRGINSLLRPYITSGAYKNYLASMNLPELYGTGLFEEVLRYAIYARAIALEEEFDVIHAHDWLSFPAGLEAKRVSGKPFVAHVHATEFDRTGGGAVNQGVYEIERKGMREADAVVAVSNYTKRTITNRYGIRPEKVSVVWNGIDASEYRIGSSDALRLKEAGAKIVLFVGRLTLQKGPDYFLETARKVLKYEPNTYFIISGSGDMERQIIEEAAWLGLGDRVLFAGFNRGEDLVRLYRAADLFVMPSVSEPFGITPLESLVAGTPVLISKQSGVAETLRHALTTDFWDTDEAANKVVAVLRSKALKDQLGEYGGAEAEKMTWRDAARKCIDVYRNLLGMNKYPVSSI